MFCKENHFFSTSSFSAEKLVQNLSPKDAAQDRLSILHSLQGDNLEDKDISAALREKKKIKRQRISCTTGQVKC